MQLEIYKINYPFKVVITEKLKSRVISQLETVSPNTALGFALHDFSRKPDEKTDEDFKELLNDLYSELREGPSLMKIILGKTFIFFRELLS